MSLAELKVLKQILKIVGLTSTQKLVQGRRDAQVFIKASYIFKQRGT